MNGFLLRKPSNAYQFVHLASETLRSVRYRLVKIFDFSVDWPNQAIAPKVR
jgi:hypothetical protein